MIRIIELPQVGESVTEGVIGKWLVEPGQHVERYDPLVEVVTDKVSMEAPSPYTGVFVRALAEEGETVPMGQPICEMEVEGDEPGVVPAEAGTSQPDPVIPAQAGTQGARAAHEAGSGDEGDEPDSAAPPSSLFAESAGESEPAADDAEEAPTEEESADVDAGRVGGAWAMPAAHGAEPQESGQGEEAGQHTFEFMDSVRSVGPTGSGERGEGRPDALQEQALAEREHETAAPSVPEPDRSHVISPLVARLSAQYGIDLSTVRGTGTGGRITSKDLLEAVSRMTAGVQEEAAEEHLSVEEAEGEVPSGPLSLEGRGRAESAGEGKPEEPETAVEPAPEEVAEEAAPEAPEAEAEAEAASPVIPAQAGIQGARAAHEGEAETEEEATEEEEEAPEEEGVEDVEEALDEAEEAAAPDPLSLQGERAGERVPWGGVAEDVEEEEAPEEPAPAAAEDTSVMPLTPVRRIIAEHMARSSREIPAAWSMVEVDVTRLVRTRDALKAAFEERHGVPLTYLPFAAGAVAAVLREHPRLNARWDDGHITLNNRVNLAIAVSTEAGLMVPVLRDADTLTIAGIAAELRRLSDGARAGTLGIDDVQGGTFTLNNTGALGSVVSVPIINHPQAAIMTTEAIVKRPVVVEGDAIAVRSMMNLCLTFDHRVCDGAEAAAFLSAVKARLEVIDESIGLG